MGKRYTRVHPRAKWNLPILLIVLLVQIPAHAEFKITELLIEPEEYSETDQIVVFVTVSNVGELREEQSFILYVDQQAVAQENVSLSSGEAQRLIFILQPDFDIGIHEVTIGDISGQFTVTPPMKRKPWTFILTCLAIAIVGLTYLLYDMGYLK